MQKYKYIKLSEIHAALLNETFSLKTDNGQMTAEILHVDSHYVYAKGFLGHDMHTHEIVVKLTNENGVSEEADITAIELYDDLSSGFGDRRNAREIKELMVNIVQAIDAHVTKNHHADGVKSMLKEAVFEHNE